MLWCVSRAAADGKGGWGQQRWQREDEGVRWGVGHSLRNGWPEGWVGGEGKCSAPRVHGQRCGMAAALPVSAGEGVAPGSVLPPPALPAPHPASSLIPLAAARCVSPHCTSASSSCAPARVGACAAPSAACGAHARRLILWPTPRHTPTHFVHLTCRLASPPARCGASAELTRLA